MDSANSEIPVSKELTGARGGGGRSSPRSGRCGRSVGVVGIPLRDISTSDTVLPCTAHRTRPRTLRSPCLAVLNRQVSLQVLLPHQLKQHRQHPLPVPASPRPRIGLPASNANDQHCGDTGARTPPGQQHNSRRSFAANSDERTQCSRSGDRPRRRVEGGPVVGAVLRRQKQQSGNGLAASARSRPRSPRTVCYGAGINMAAVLSRYGNVRSDGPHT